ncbi:MAG: phosphatidate cytidylyltransferase [Alphaproteobacteria bacterium]|nr:phosphatidate cytidylyltransferase [Alphaproteobacteria bacterium]
MLAVVGVILVVGSAVGEGVARQATTPRERVAAADLRARIRAWWWMIPTMVAFLALGRLGIVGFFALVSFLALRELVTLLPSRRADHTTLVLAFFLAVPVQYALIWTGWTAMFLVFVPVWALAVVSVRLALAGDTERFLHRLAAIQYALMVGVYCVSHAPALLLLRIDGYEGQAHKLVVFLVVVTQSSDVLQFLWGKALGRTPLTPALSPSKTVEGLVGGVLSATAVGALLTPLTPFSPLEAALLALTCALAGWAGGAVMSAIKRDAGIKDYGTLIAGHGGVLDRVDSLVFAAPVLFHLLAWLHA